MTATAPDGTATACDQTGPAAGERGSTLIELVVAIAIVALMAGFAFESLAQRPAQAAATAVAFASLVAEARALAAITADPAAGSTGATIAVVRDGDAYVATLYAYRPVRGALRTPVPAAGTPPLRTSTALAIVGGNGRLAPPFALFFSASGHASARAPYTIGTDAPLAQEPACPLETGIPIAFIDGVHDQAHPISCEMAQLELDVSAPL
jgi:prepilin-type N-terminal cleavage/methylation domain-containing protein